MKKEDIRTYIEKKSKEQKEKLHAEVYKEALKRIDLVLRDLWPLGNKAEAQAAALAQTLERMHREYKFGDYQFTRFIRDLDQYGDPVTSRIKEQARRITDNLLRRYTDGTHEALAGIRVDLAKRFAKEVEQYHGILKLEGEIETIVSAAPNGKKAYDQLVKLGVDLSGMETDSAMLPAIVKLSVNPCLLTGDCK